jgi:hypothetical protein
MYELVGGNGACYKTSARRAVARRDYQAGEATLRFQLGFRPQKIRFADVRLLNFADRVEFPDLPAMPLAYKGMEPGAAWRQEAWERIERHRKSDVTLMVTDANGNPVSDAQVSLEQTRLERTARRMGRGQRSLHAR